MNMEQKSKQDEKRIELRSEKVRNIIGQMPPFLIRWGNSILIIILVILIGAYYVLKQFYLL